MSFTTTKIRFHTWYSICADKNISWPAKAMAGVLLLKHLNNATGCCNPKLSTLATSIGITHSRNLHRYIYELYDAGWMGWDQKTGQFSFKLMSADQTKKKKVANG
jgi:hypothetical protein